MANDVFLFPVSFAQQQVWLLDRLVPGSPVYNLPGAIYFDGRLNLHVLEQSLNEIIRRHEILRTTFPTEDGRPVQAVGEFRPLSLAMEDLSALPFVERESELARRLYEEAGWSFDIIRGPLLRAKLLRMAAAKHVLLLTSHHIVSDGWSLGVFQRELAALYESFLGGSPSPLPELPIQYADYAVWQREWLTGEVLDEQLEYWRQQLDGNLPVLELPADYARPRIQTFSGARTSLTLSAGLSERLNSLGVQEESTLFMVLLAAFEVLLHRYTGQEDILIGAPVAGRNQVETEALIGLFINTLVLRNRVSSSNSFDEILRRVKRVALEAYAHQDLPFERLIEEMKPERDASRIPLVQSMFTFQNSPLPSFDLPGLSMKLHELDNRTAKFDVALNLTQSPDGIGGFIEYSTELFTEETIRRMAEHYRVLLEAVVANPRQRLSELSLLTTEERRQVLYQWNDTREDYPSERCLHELFEAQVERTPDAVAIVYEEERVSYRELNRRANQLAHHLRGLGVGAESLVGILMDRSIELVVALLGVLKAGGAYVPLDAEYPSQRLSFMMEDAGVSVLLTQEHLSGKVTFKADTQIVCVDSEWEEIARQSGENIESGAASDNMIYVIYTSGSTGSPKGVMLPHRGIVNCLSWLQSTFRIGAQDRVMFKASLSFDASVWELFWPLSVGASVVVARPGGHRDGAYLAQAIAHYGVSTMHFVPSMLNVMLDEKRFVAASSLKRVLCGGEAMPVETLERFYAQATGELHNFYGPTETSIGSTDWPCRPLNRRTVVPIGGPIANTRVYVLDPHLQPAPIGVAGHLHIGGDGLARGYLKQPALTAERFIPDPFSTKPGAHLYKTGDLVRYLSSGEIEYLGRTDKQLKVRGHRIEPGEVESALRVHPSVADAIVLARSVNKGAPQLIAYVVPNDAAGVAGMELRRHLKDRLPDYMIPRAFVTLEQIPLMPNGKVDHEALPAPEQDGTDGRASYVAPRTPTEEVLAGVLAQVLAVAQVGIHDSFFELGGHSLLAAQVISRVRVLFAVELPLVNLFEAPTVVGLCEAIETAIREQRGPSAPAIVPVIRNNALPLSFAQRRLWFLDQLEPNSVLYNIPAAIRLIGQLNVSALEQALNEIIKRHEALRTTFTGAAGEPVQIIHPAEPLGLKVEDLTELIEEQRQAEVQRQVREQAQQPFDLTRAPLLRVRLLRLSAEEHVLVAVMHHIISDGWSMSVMVREVAALYEAYIEGRPSPLPALPIQYADYAVWQREWLQGAVLERELEYWREQLEGAPPVLELPADHPRPSVQTFSGARQHFSISREVAARLKEMSHQEGVTLFMTLLAAFSILLSRYSGQEEVVIGTPIAGRTRAETEGLIGFFVNTLALRVGVRKDLTFRELLQRVREVCLGAYAHQEMPFEKLVELSKYNRSANYHPIFQVACALQDDSLVSLKLPGLDAGLLEMEHDVVRYDLRLNVLRTPDKITCSFEYKTDLFHAPTIVRMADHLQTLLELVTTQPDAQLSALAEVLAEEERKRETDYERALAEASARKLRAVKRKAVRGPLLEV